jgi:hypothetical protein
MKILNKQEPWPSKVNFVDENEVHLGYDLSDDCCAHGGWFMLDDPEAWPGKDSNDWLKEPEPYPDLHGWVFDPSYFKERTIDAISEGSAVQFSVVNGDARKYITLYNCHNGYYGKGFEFVVTKETSKNRESII